MFARTIGNFVTNGIKILIIILIMASSVVASADVSVVREVNSKVNKSRYIKDIDLYNANDYFATPEEFRINGGGDDDANLYDSDIRVTTIKSGGEDFAIAKYFILVEQGIDKNELFFTYVRGNEHSTLHMVLLYYGSANSDPLILDNTRTRLMYLSEMVDIEVVVSYHYNTEMFYGDNKGISMSQLYGSTVYLKWYDLKQRLS